MKPPSMLQRAVTLVTGLLIPLGCISFSGCVATPPPVTPSMTISAKVPAITSVADGEGATNQSGVRRMPEAQEKGGVEIAVVPATYRAKKEKVTIQPVNPGVGNAVLASLTTGGNSKNQVYVQEVTIPYLEVDPGRLLFTVRVNNKLSRVFRGQGAVVQFNVAGKLVPFGEADYAELMNGIVPPRNENTFTIRGPRLDSIPDKCTIGIFFYDVVTATDVAGNTTEKQNYEWYFDYVAKPVSEAAERRITQGFIDAATYQQRMAQEQMESMRAASAQGRFPR